MFPEFLIKPLAYLGVIAALLSTAFIKGCEYEQDKWNASKQIAIAQNLVIQGKQNIITHDVKVRYVEKIKVVKIKGDEVIRAVPHYIHDTDCPVPGNFVRLWNYANDPAKPLSLTPLDSDETAGGIGLLQIAIQHSHEARYCRGAEAQLISLQDWITQQQGVKP